MMKSFDFKRLAAGLIAAASAMALSACITLLPEEKPAQLYRFGYQGQAVTSVNLTNKPSLYLSDIAFVTAAQSERIFTTQGQSASYIAHIRWVAPAQTLFTEAVETGFGQDRSKVRLVAFGRGKADKRLDLKVTRFEVSYHDSKPAIIVEMDATIVRLADKKILASAHFVETEALKEDRIKYITEGFERAVTKSVDSLIDFSSQDLSQAN